MTILEGNKLIAEFDDCVSIKPKEKIYKYEIDGDSWALEGLKYHSSWDWQIPVWTKIVPLIKKLATDNNDCFDQYQRFINYYNGAVATNQPGYGHEILVAAIQWYNSQPKTDNNDK